MPGVTEEQITAAKQMSAIEFLRRYRPGQLVKAESRGEFQLKEHTALKSTKPQAFGIGKVGMSAAKAPLTILLRLRG